MLKKKNVVVGVCGGIAAYKACDLVSRLKKEEADVVVIMTKNACEFVTPLTFQTLSNNTVYTDMFKLIKNEEWQIDHISIAKKCDLFIIAPATANVIGKLANGIADDLLTTTALSIKSKIFICPAMNSNMWNNKIVQGNVSKLKENGVLFIGPATGDLACGDKGAGRMEEPKIIIKKIQGEERK